MAIGDDIIKLQYDETESYFKKIDDNPNLVEIITRAKIRNWNFGPINQIPSLRDKGCIKLYCEVPAVIRDRFKLESNILYGMICSDTKDDKPNYILYEPITKGDIEEDMKIKYKL